MEAGINHSGYFNCPACGEPVLVILSKYSEPIDRALELDNSDHFEGKAKCKCDASLIITLHITALEG